jgi:hypothetical protein
LDEVDIIFYKKTKRPLSCNNILPLYTLAHKRTNLSRRYSKNLNHQGSSRLAHSLYANIQSTTSISNFKTSRSAHQEESTFKMKLQFFILMAILSTLSLQSPVLGQPTTSLSISASLLASTPASISPTVKLLGQDSNNGSDNGDLTKAEETTKSLLKGLAIIGVMVATLCGFLGVLIYCYCTSKERKARLEVEAAAGDGQGYDDNGKGYNVDRQVYEGDGQNYEGDAKGYKGDGRAYNGGGKGYN